MHELERSTNPFDAIRCEDDAGEWWSARALMPVMGYGKWDNFEEAIIRARAAAGNSGFDPDQHASRLRETVPIRHNAGQQLRTNYRLTRFGAYLVAMNGDPRKEEIARAQTYFTIRTREAEITSMIPGPRRQPTNRELAMMVIEEADRADRAEQALGIAAPKADAWQVLAEAIGDYSVREAAHILGRDPQIDTGQRRLFARLREWKLIDRGNIPYQGHKDHVKLRARFFIDAFGERRTEDQVRITAEGLRYLHKKLGGTTPFTTLLESWQAGEQPAVPSQQPAIPAQAVPLFELGPAR